ncbi:class I SAM-dependent methyltransferase [Methanococcoides methylutens]|uniref:class I SAM-dependent methyltransferase n=1 Tax=Methanococcoides methylutens TaxID=2226 RepID=UPI004043A833
MRLIDKFIHKLILKNGFKYYSEDKYLIKEILKFSENEKPKVLDVGCGIGHYSILFEKYGANAIAFDCDKTVINKANEKKNELNSNVDFLIADGRFPEKHFTEKFDIIFMAGFSVFGINLDKEVMGKYLSLLDVGGKLILVHNSNLTGLVRKTHWKNHTIEELNTFFESLGRSIKKIYFYDRHIIIKILRHFVFTNFSTKLYSLMSKITQLPCALVFVVGKGEYDN